jgi:hypothetical protein
VKLHIIDKPGVKERAVAEIARSYDGAIVWPDEFETFPT